MGSMKILVALAFLAIIASLGSALFFMMRGNGNDRQRSKHMARALALRVGLSIVLFLCLLLAWRLGYIQPTGLPVNMRLGQLRKSPLLRAFLRSGWGVIPNTPGCTAPARPRPRSASTRRRPRSRNAARP
ncbi:MAG: twin transmembrane helix small protein [Proteobacteria bacterium]|nr:twin transmembrane helix small protein [Pseudomonadota bacterium]